MAAARAGSRSASAPMAAATFPRCSIPALDELSAAWAEARADAEFRTALAALLRDFVGRPTAAVPRRAAVASASGRRIYLKREDLAHTGAHKINNAVGQALLANRMGKRRVIAETGAGQHGVAAATACALLGLECVVYMGAEDMRRQAPNVERMRLLGAEVAPVEAGAQTLKEAVSAAIRDWVTNVAHHPLHHRLGGGPGPLSGAGSRPPAGDRRRGPRAGAGGRGHAARARDRLRRRRLELDRHLLRVHRRRGGGADRGRGRAVRGSTPATARPWSRGGPGSCTAPSPRCSPTTRGRSSRPTRSPPGSTTRASGPEHAQLRDSGTGALRGGHRRRCASRLPRARTAGGDHPRAGACARDRLAA